LRRSEYTRQRAGKPPRLTAAEIISQLASLSWPKETSIDTEIQWLHTDPQDFEVTIEATFAREDLDPFVSFLFSQPHKLRVQDEDEVRKP
jgi:hypothetical protein